MDQTEVAPERAVVATDAGGAESGGQRGADDAAPPTATAELLQRERDRAAHQTRLAVEAEWRGKQETLQARNAELEQAEQERQRAAMDEQTRMQADLQEAQSQAQLGTQQSAALQQEVERLQRNTRIADLIAGSATRVPRPYLSVVYERLAAIEDLSPEVVDGALRATHEEWAADSEALLPIPRGGTDVGSAGAPAWTPPSRGLSEAEQEAAEVDFARRVQARDPAALKEAQKRWSR